MIRTIRYDINSLGGFDDEWLCHRRCMDWWYATGYFTDSEGAMYSWQFTILNLYLGLVTSRMAMTALTDLRTGKHYYRQKASLGSGGLSVDGNLIAFDGVASAEKGPDGMTVRTGHRDFRLDLRLGYGKGAFWHCDNGRVQMGSPGGKETTYYYSYTNMPTRGTLILDGRRMEVTGKSWFDKEGGTLTPGKPETVWEWFSLRFYDDEEMMLFTFPRGTEGFRRDGTYITKDGGRERLNDYDIRTTRTIECRGSKWSSGWELYVPGKKEKRYTIEPLFEGNMNFAYFEELCSVRNAAGKEVGLCFTELLPGVHDSRKAVSLSMLFRSVEY